MWPARISSAPESTSAREHVRCAARPAACARAPRRADQMVVQRHDAQRARRPPRARPRRPRSSCAVAHAARLVPPRPHRVQPDDVRARRLREDRLASSPSAARTRRHGAREARREGVRDVVVPRDREHRRAEPAQERRRARRARRAVPRCVRSPLATTSSGRTRSIRPRAPAPPRVVSCAPRCRSETWRMPGCHSRSRLYTEVAWPTSLDRDLRRPLSRPASRRRAAQEAPRRVADRPRSRRRSAAGSGSRRGARRVAIGGFAVGTFGLGFTLGGLVFGRWRKA